MLLSGFADEISPVFDRQLEVLHELNMSYLEIRGVDGKSISQLDQSELDTVRKKLISSSIGVSSIGSPIGKISITDSFDKHFELFKSTCEKAHKLDTRYIRIFSFYIPENDNPASYRDEVMQRLSRMSDYAASQELVLLHENEKGIYGNNAARCLDIMETLYSDHFAAVFDFANFIQENQETIEAYNLLKPYIKYVHIKDAVGSQVVPPGHGSGHLLEIISDLNKSCYNGFYSLEPHLADFEGFHRLEHGGVGPARKLTGCEAFRLSYDSFMEIASQIPGLIDQ
jgi:sugar phosphate isomerase/epimerase